MSEPTTQEVLTQDLRLASGRRHTKDPLVVFLYLLMRDEVAAGVVANLLKESFPDKPNEEIYLSNGFLGQYAEWVAERLRPTIESEADTARRRGAEAIRLGQGLGKEIAKEMLSFPDQPIEDAFLSYALADLTKASLQPIGEPLSIIGLSETIERLSTGHAAEFLPSPEVELKKEPPYKYPPLDKVIQANVPGVTLVAAASTEQIPTKVCLCPTKSTLFHDSRECPLYEWSRTVFPGMPATIVDDAEPRISKEVCGCVDKLNSFHGYPPCPLYGQPRRRSPGVAPAAVGQEADEVCEEKPQPIGKCSAGLHDVYTDVGFCGGCHPERA